MSHLLDRELQTHARALRRLARSLVGDQHADDLVQDTALSALRQDTRPESLRSWLFAVLRRLASKHHRRERRRLLREAAAGLPASHPGPDRAAEHKETLQQLTAALVALPEPYQRTLLLRYFEELMPSAIAMQTRVPVATVKTRLARGLQLLRERLDAAAERSDWRAALGAVFGLRPVSIGAATTTVAGVMLMGTGMKLLLGGAAAGLAVSVLCWWPTEATPAVATAAPIVDAAEPGAAAGSVDAAAAHNVARIEAPATTTASAGALASVRGRCVDELGHGLAAVDITVHLNSPPGAVPPASPSQPPLRLVTTTAGAFEFQCDPLAHGALQLQFAIAGRCPIHGWLRDLAPGSTRDLGDLLLPFAIAVQGHVRDTDGKPVANATVGIWADRVERPDLFADDSVQATTAADGTFGPCGPLSPGRGHAMVVGRRLAQAIPELHFDAATPLLEVDLVVRSDRELPPIRGVVVDERGIAVAHANVSLDSTPTPTAEDGSFTLRAGEDSSGDGPFALHASKEGHVPVTVAKVALGTRDLHIVLPHARELRVRVQQADHGTVTDFALDLIQGTADCPGSRMRHQVTQHWPDGVARLQGIKPGNYLVHVTPSTTALEPSGFVPVSVGAETGGEATVEVTAGHTRLLRLTDATGTAVQAQIELIDACGQPLHLDTYAFALEDWEELLGPMRLLLLQHGRTDARGELRLRGPALRDLTLRCRGSGLALQTFTPIRFDDDAPLDLTVQRGGQWTGTIEPPGVAAALIDAEPALPHLQLRQRLVGIELRRDDEGLCNSREPLFAFARDGSFHIDGIPAGTWRVLVWALGSPRHVGDITVREGETLVHDLDLHALRPCAVDLQVFVDGQPYASGKLMLEFEPDADSERAQSEVQMRETDDEGHARWTSLPGRLGCQVYVPDGGSRFHVLAPPLQVPLADHFEQVFDLRTARLCLRVLQPDGQPAAGVEVQLTSLGYDEVTLQMDGDGRRTAPILRGNHKVRVYPRRLAGWQARQDFARANGEAALQAARIDLGNIDVGPNPAPVELRLPHEWDR